MFFSKFYLKHNSPVVVRQKQMETAQSKPEWVPKKSKSIGIGRTLYIHCQQWGTGQKFLHIYVSQFAWPVSTYLHLPGILVPQGAYNFVAAMDQVILQLPVEEPTHPEDDNSPLILATQIVRGTRKYNFKLAAWHQNGGEWNFEIQSVLLTSRKHKEPLHFPFSAFPWLRKQMVEMLEEHDGTERIYEMPIIPEWATRAAPNIEQAQQLNVHCSLCAVANAKKKGSKCWWHMPTSREWPIADNYGMENASKSGHCH